MTKLDYMRRLRKMRYAQGLTATGQDRKNQRRPELAGLGKREYHTAYMRAQRAWDRLAYATDSTLP